MLVTKSLENMIDKEEASAFTAFTDGRVHKSNVFDPSDTSEIINVTLTSTVSTEEDIPLKKLDEAETKKVSKNVEILTEETNKDIIKNGDDDNEHLGKKSEDEKLATENSEILIETEKETTPQQNSVEKEETNEKEKTTSSTNESQNNDNSKEIKIQNDASKVDDKESMEEDSKIDVDNVNKQEPIKEHQNEAENSEKNNSENKKVAILLEPVNQSNCEVEEETKKEGKKSEESVRNYTPLLSTSPSVDYNEGLEELTNIANSGKNINEADGQKKITNGHKRSLSVSDEAIELAKRPKIEEDTNLEQDIKFEFNNSIKKTIKKLSREDLEEMVTNKIAESISAHSTISDLRHKCDKHELDVEKWKRKTQMLQKVCSDLNTVMKRYILDIQNKQDNPTPIKITRSVGLQVVTDQVHKQALTPQNQISRQMIPMVMQSPSPQATKINPIKTPQNLISHSPSATITPSNVFSKSNDILVTTPTVSFTPVTPNPTTMTAIVSENVIPQKLPENMAKINTNSNSPSRLQSLPRPVLVIQKQSSATTSTSSTNNGAKQVIDIIDLSDEEDHKPKQAKPPNNGIRMVPTANLVQVNNQGHTVLKTPVAIMQSKKSTLQMTTVMKHPASLPDPPKFQISEQSMKSAPPKPTLKISRVTDGIILSWNMNLNLTIHASIASYQIYAYQEQAAQPVVSTLWKKVGDVKALDLPMACTLTQFSKGNKYHFAVRARDCHSRVGNFSDPLSISLT